MPNAGSILAVYVAYTKTGITIHVAVDAGDGNYKGYQRTWPNHYAPSQYLINETADKGTKLTEETASKVFPLLAGQHQPVA